MSETIVLIPTLNEAQGLRQTIREIVKEVEKAKIIVVDSNSKDGTPEIAAGLGAKVITHVERGKGHAITEGFHCARSDATWLAIVDGDYSYPAVYIPKMINILKGKPDVGMVVGRAYASYQEHYTLWKRIKWVYLNPRVWFHRVLVTLHCILNGVNVEDPLNGERVIRLDCVKDFQPKSKGFDIEVEINCYIRKKGYKVVEVPIRPRCRLGKSKFHNFKHCLVILRRMIIEALTRQRTYVYERDVGDQNEMGGEISYRGKISSERQEFSLHDCFLFCYSCNFHKSK